MIVRTYGRRNPNPNRGGSSFDYDDDISSPNPSSQDVFAFSSQDSYNPNPNPNFDFNSDSLHGDVFEKPPKKQKNGEREIGGLNLISSKESDSDSERFGCLGLGFRGGGGGGSYSMMNTTLMETQEYGEMMEHVDEINFAIDGLRKGQPVRIRRASLLSLLRICESAAQRRLLRSHGMAKNIIDAVIGLSFDDPASNLAAATLFYVLISDGQDDHLLESPSCIHFLIKLLKPAVSATAEDRLSKIGSKLLQLRQDSGFLRSTDNKLDQSTANIRSKVKEILASSKELKSTCWDDDDLARPELSAKWVSLLTMEKASVSTIALDESSGIVRKTGGNFKEKAREFGGLDAVFDVAMQCHSTMEGWRQHSSSSWDAKDDIYLRDLVHLLKCLKIMENATFLSKDNQTHLLEMRRRSNAQSSHLSFVKVIIDVVKILSGVYLLKSSPTVLDRDSNASNGTCRNSDSIMDKVDGDEGLPIKSFERHCSMERIASHESHDTLEDSRWLQSAPFRYPKSILETTTSSSNGSCSLKNRLGSSAASSRCETSKSAASMASLGRNILKNSSLEKSYSTEGATVEPSDYQLDPFAFDEDEFQPSKWEKLSVKKKPLKKKRGGLMSREAEKPCQLHLLRQQESDVEISSKDELSNSLEDHSQEASSSGALDVEKSGLLADCLLTAVKVLMNLTNDNLVGCRQIASCGGLETMASVIADHFPSFRSSTLLHSDLYKDSKGSELDQLGDINLTDQELDFLVAILGLLVNLVEKDERNRCRLARASVALPDSQGLYEESKEGVIPLLCSIFLAHRGPNDAAADENPFSWDDEAAIMQGEKEAEKMIVEAYAALLLAFLSTESKDTRDMIAACLPRGSLAVLVPVLERFVAFHLTLEMMTPETHKAVSEVIESCKLP